MHKLLRQYAEEKLREVPQGIELTQDAHCRYFAEFLRQREPNLKGAKQKEALGEMSEESQNVRASWKWAVERYRVEEIGKFLESLYLFYEARGLFREGTEAFGRAVESLEGTSAAGGEAGERHTLVLGRALARQGTFCHRLGLYRQARELLKRSLAIFRNLGAQRDMAFSLTSLGAGAYMVMEYGEAKQLHQEGLQLARAIGDLHEMTKSLNGLGLVAEALGQFVEAKRLFQESLVISKESGNPYAIAQSLSYLGLVALRAPNKTGVDGVS